MVSGSGGGGDPERTLRLLWRDTAEPARGPQPGLSVDRVVAAAVAVADAEVVAPVQGADWRARLWRVAWNNWELYHRHPWLLGAVTGRPLLGPNETVKYDAELRAFDGVGLTDVERDAVLSVVLGLARECARAAVELARLAERTGWDEARWWRVHGPLLERYVDAGRFPVAARVGQAAGAAHQAALSPRYTFEFGLACLCDGVEALLRRRGDGQGGVT